MTGVLIARHDPWLAAVLPAGLSIKAGVHQPSARLPPNSARQLTGMSRYAAGARGLGTDRRLMRQEMPLANEEREVNADPIAAAEALISFASTISRLASRLLAPWQKIDTTLG
jgi:hypothetical protein